MAASESKAKGTASPLEPPQRSPADLAFRPGKPISGAGHKAGLLPTARLVRLCFSSKRELAAGGIGWMVRLGGRRTWWPSWETGPSSQPRGAQPLSSSLSLNRI